ncbi:MAG: hypothetical protein GVY25_15655 [Bacteroidetes bacterium]|jgi:hypothetical protein|nr:hypothetical protein [Bacteroidota bacterium]
MKRLLYGVAALIFAGIFVSIIGIVADEANLTLWTQALMWCLLGTVLIVPAVVYAASSSSGADTQVPDSPLDETAGTTSAASGQEMRSGVRERFDRPKRSVGRILAYVVSVGLVVWTAVSMVSLFVDQSRLSFWTQSVMWSLLALVVWAPVMAFWVNPFQDPSLQSSPQQVPVTGEPEDFVPASSPAHAVSTPQHAGDTVTPSGIPADEQPTVSESQSEEDDDATRSGEHVV